MQLDLILDRSPKLTSILVGFYSPFVTPLILLEKPDVHYYNSPIKIAEIAIN